MSLSRDRRRYPSFLLHLNPRVSVLVTSERSLATNRPPIVESLPHRREDSGRWSKRTANDCNHSGNNVVSSPTRPRRCLIFPLVSRESASPRRNRGGRFVRGDLLSFDTCLRESSVLSCRSRGAGGPGEGRREHVPPSVLPYLVSREQLVYISTAASLAPERRGSYPVCGLCTLDNVRLGRLYDARSTYGVLQVVERRGVRAVRRPVPVVIIDVLQLAFLRHISWNERHIAV